MAPQTSCATRRSQTAIRTWPASLTHGLRFLVLAVAYMLAGPHPAANTGGASYNLPVSVASSGQLTYTCKGPPSGTYGNSNYPSNCGNPTASCVGNVPTCDNAYFFPTPSPQPNSEAQPGQILVITFLAGS
jgi:hypothetical protein